MTQRELRQDLFRTLCARQQASATRGFLFARRTDESTARALGRRFLAALCLTFGVASAHAADIAIEMLDTSKDGPLSFEPVFVKAQIGDTLVFSPSSKGHTTESLLVPAGAKPWKSGYDRETRVTLEQEGVYLYTCEAHRRMGMVGVVQVGKPVNLEAAKAAAAAAGAQFVMNKDRFAKALAQVR
ncbi:plastocyanin/azurin family copper-binding protein [Accumulibacter sp.]|uniref:plastocyanin/azurin family copper-binding protein n=1 Tax=Accumulibacter sp. TaxID=2053492 RepID=UPI0028C42717|nr:plastocyanin/azurin family copper-binding protein [Accumulibacter sp.]